MTTPRWDETWHRILEWTNDQGPSERLVAQVLLSEGYTALDPSHPLGGKDGGKDAVCLKAGQRWVMGVYFPRGQQPFKDIQEKFRSDLEAAQANQAMGFAFVTNQELRLAERQALEANWPNRVELFHLERLTAILDSPRMQSARKQFLGIDFDDRPRGGRGGDADALGGGAALGGSGGDAGPNGHGGRGGNANADGAGSRAIGGPGGRGGVGPGGKGTDATAATGGFSIGGEGGEAARPDGRGGRGGRSGARLLGDAQARLPDGRFPGEGGRGPNTPAYDGKVATIKALLREYYNEPPSRLTSRDVHAAVPLDWLNENLGAMGANWRVQLDDGEFAFVEVLNPGVCADGNMAGHVIGSGRRLSPQRSREQDGPPRGISLIICRRIDWTEGVEIGSFPRNFTNTLDAFNVDGFPHECGPFAAYVRFSGGGSVTVCLDLVAPNGEVMYAKHITATNWGEIGAWEGSYTISNVTFREPGIYHIRLRHGSEVLLDYPITVRQRVQESGAADQTADASNGVTSDRELSPPIPN